MENIELKTISRDYFTRNHNCIECLVVGISEKANNETIKKSLPAGFVVAKLQDLLDYKKDPAIKVTGTVVALGSVGPQPYDGNPGLTIDGQIISFGLSKVATLEWSTDTLFLLVRDQTVAAKK